MNMTKHQLELLEMVLSIVLDKKGKLEDIISLDQFHHHLKKHNSKELKKMMKLLVPLLHEFSLICREVEELEKRMNELEKEDMDAKKKMKCSRKMSTDFDSASMSSTGWITAESSSWSEGVESGEFPDFSTIRKARTKNRQATLNIGGERHEIVWDMLETVPSSRLGRLAVAADHKTIMDLCNAYSLVDNEFFFDRHPKTFSSILNFYRAGKLHIPEGSCVIAFRDDLDYWGISEVYLENCCQNKYNVRKENAEEEMEGKEPVGLEEVKQMYNNEPLEMYKAKLWELMEDPESSVAAKVVSIISLLFVLMSTGGMVLNTLPSWSHVDTHGNVVDNPYLAVVESVSIVWFTIEFVLRGLGSPDTADFLKNGMNIVDVLSVLPYYFSLVTSQTVIVPETTTSSQPTSYGPMLTNITVDDDNQQTDQSSSFQQVLQIFRMFKLARIFKLARHSTGLKAILFTVQNSFKELGLLILFIMIAGLVFSSLCYFCEKDVDDTGYSSIPASFWWAVITMTTVGYGDMYPVTSLGKLVGIFCAMSGIIVMSLPIPIIVGNFEKFYSIQRKAEKEAMRRERLEEAGNREEEELDVIHSLLDHVDGEQQKLVPHYKY